MGRSVSYPSAATVITFTSITPDEERYYVEEGTDEDGEYEWVVYDREDEDDPYLFAFSSRSEAIACAAARNGEQDSDDFDMLIDDFRDQLRVMFPSVTSADSWIGREDHVLAENKLAQFGMSEYCGLVSYWIVPKESGYYSDDPIGPFAKRWVESIADKFVAAFGELTKVGSFSNGEGVYRQIRKGE